MRDWAELIDPERDAREKFFAWLLRKTPTRKQAREYLLRMKLPESLLDDAVDSGLVDDEAYARLFAEGHTSWGNAKISHELSVRGVSQEDIRLAIDGIADEAERACELVEAWRKSGVEDRKIVSRLLSRGFTNRAVRYALSND
ncbi:MAG: RecX family transcriptional regulator [Synergistaceae bacterium]|nr:RecX family transcriptional regulator [Synergistaceae bacterium]